MTYIMEAAKNSSNNNSGRDSAIGSSEMGDSCTSSWSSSWATTTTTTPEHPQQQQQTKQQNNGERRRRRLPEIPKKKSLMTRSAPSLAEELDAAARAAAAAVTAGRPHLMQQIQSKGLRLWPTQAPIQQQQQQDDTSPTDSGHSTAHSPDNGPKSVSPTSGQAHNLLQSSIVSLGGDSSSGGPLSPQISTPGSAAGLLSFTQLELLEATHRGLHKFVPRHRDEIELEIGDPVYVQKEADDLWCEGVNLRTGRQGIFPSAYAVDLDYSDFDPSAPKVKRERFLLGYLGSVETQAHKGTGVVCQAVRRIVGSGGGGGGEGSSVGPQPQGCVLEISDQGLRMLDRSGGKHRQSSGRNNCHDYFYSLKNVSFCAFHPRDHRYLGFITKHPTLQRFACHVFVGQESTRPVAEAVGRAFHRFYTKFVETAFPIEDIYIE
ncbi:unnamed protein product [Trichogramma brassicae]|uniref:SH3 domain-containing protein n=1 Tax=Trichogramma brassicae TaxID=86971 RepID=A0A6H5IPR9_9HYME|nr:unnamed protein product [Trichogramma brassicae]